MIISVDSAVSGRRLGQKCIVQLLDNITMQVVEKCLRRWGNCRISAVRAFLYIFIITYNIKQIITRFFFNRTSTYGRMVAAASGTLLIIGSFKKRTPDPDFKVCKNIAFNALKFHQLLSFGWKQCSQATLTGCWCRVFLQNSWILCANLLCNFNPNILVPSSCVPTCIRLNAMSLIKIKICFPYLFTKNWSYLFFFLVSLQLFLSSNITMADYNMGYCLTGTLERGCRQTNNFQITHFAVIRRTKPTYDEIKS